MRKHDHSRRSRMRLPGLIGRTLLAASASIPGDASNNLFVQSVNTAWASRDYTAIAAVIQDALDVRTEDVTVLYTAYNFYLMIQPDLAVRRCVCFLMRFSRDYQTFANKVCHRHHKRSLIAFTHVHQRSSRSLSWRFGFKLRRRNSTLWCSTPIIATFSSETPAARSLQCRPSR